MADGDSVAEGSSLPVGEVPVDEAKDSNRWFMSKRASRNWRDAALFLTGLGLTIYEVVIRTGPERPTILILLAGMMGLPAFLRGDEKQNNREDTKV